MRFKRPIIGLLWFLLAYLVIFVAVGIAVGVICASIYNNASMAQLISRKIISGYQNTILLLIFVPIALAAVRGILPGTKPGTLSDERSRAIGFKDSFVLLLYFVIIQIAIGIITGAMCEVAGRPDLTGLPLTSCLMSIAASICYGLFTIWISRAEPRELMQFKKTSWHVLPIVLLALAGAEIMSSEIDNFHRTLITYPDFFAEILRDVLGQGIASLIAVALVAPLIEEVVFRGIILGSFLKRYSPRKAIVLSALSFAIVHLNPMQMPTAFGLGILLAWVCYRSGNLWLSIAIHAAHNLFVYLIGTYPLPFQISGFNIPGRFQPVWFDLSGALLLAAALFMFASLYRPRAVADESHVSEAIL